MESDDLIGPANAGSSDEDAYDAFLEAALRGEIPSDDEIGGLVGRDAAGAGELKDVLFGLGRILRGEEAADASSHHLLEQDQDLPFERLGEFRLIRRLGHGGMGVVYLAEQESLQRLVAIKLLRPELTGSPEAEVRFRREVKAVAQLSHPNIVTVFGSGEEQGVKYLAMEWVPGRGLDEVLDRARSQGEPIPIKQAVTWGTQIAAALAAAHREGFIHRDVKPSNIRIGLDGRAMLLDFGLARKIGSASFTMTGAFTGSPYYASPEQIQAEQRQILATSDIYSLGVTLYECVTGRVPFDGDTPDRLFHQILSAEPPPPRKLRNGTSRDLETVILCAMDKNPARRYADAEVFAKDLDAVLQLQPISARPAGAITRSRRWVRQNRGVSFAIGIALSIFVTFAATFFARNMDESRRFNLFLTQARTRMEAGDHDAALAGVDQALGVRRDDPGARLLRIEIEERRRRSEAALAVDVAKARLEEFAVVSKRALELEAAILPLQHMQNVKWLTAEERETLKRARRERAESADQYEDLLYRVESAVHRATTLSPQSTAAGEVKAEYYLERWRQAKQSGDDRAAERYRRAILELDVPARYASALQSAGLAEFVSAPESLDVYLFSYRSYGDVVGGGEQRLVPVPIQGSPPVPPGTTVLRVDEDRGDLLRGDLILEARGRPIGTTNFVTRDDEILDEFLIAVDGKPALDPVFIRMEPFERLFAAGLRRADQLTPVEYEFDIGGAREVRVARTLAELDLKVWTPREALLKGAFEGTVFRDGEVFTATIPQGLRTWSTAAPLFVMPENWIGTTPLAPRDLNAGSYLALMKGDGVAAMRVPFVVKAGETAQVSGTAPDVSPPVPGMTYVPPGEFAQGGDWLALFGDPASVTFVDGFWMKTSEVTMAEYAAFLNDPDIRRRASQAEEAFLIPDHRLTTNEWDRWRRDPDTGEFIMPRSRALEPVVGLGSHAAEAYVEWLNTIWRTEGTGFAFRLPTEAQWEKAARGTDGRAYVFGDHFEPRWVKSRYANVVPMPDNVNCYPIDESVYGVVDMVGSMIEWCRVPSGTDRGKLTIIRGGSWALSVSGDFRLAKRVGQSPEVSSNHLGMRYVFDRSD